MEEKLRKYCEVLRISGTATFVFGLWSIIKTALIILTQWEMLQFIIKAMDVDNSELVFSLLLAAGILAADILLRIVVWRGTAAESRGTKSSIIYVVCAFLLLAVEIYNLIYNMTEGVWTGGGLVDSLIRSAVDFTSLFAVASVIVYGFKVKGLKKRLKENGGAVCS